MKHEIERKRDEDVWWPVTQGLKVTAGTLPRDGEDKTR